jgi:hypothetical protein
MICSLHIFARYVYAFSEEENCIREGLANRSGDLSALVVQKDLWDRFNVLVAPFYLYSLHEWTSRETINRLPHKIDAISPESDSDSVTQGLSLNLVHKLSLLF